MKILVTGGYGFIGSAFVRNLLRENSDISILNIDKLTYAGDEKNIAEFENDPRLVNKKIDISISDLVSNEVSKFKPDYIVHFAAESHVDNSIASPKEFIDSNILGTYNMIEAFRRLSDCYDSKFLHISTDEVYGELSDQNSDKFTELTPYNPSSPYSASKASSDHIVSSWARTYKLPVNIIHCSNNYGPYQNNEKLIPKTINNFLSGKQVPIYGNGKQIRDWLYVDDHIDGIKKVLFSEFVNEVFNIGGGNQISNLELVKMISKVIDEMIPQKNTLDDLITYVDDRPGHDFRYDIDYSKINHLLGWAPKENLETGIKKTIKWYIEKG